jgi:pimeloyl-ACP methyl ester carboxylesterase
VTRAAVATAVLVGLVLAGPAAARAQAPPRLQAAPCPALAVELAPVLQSARCGFLRVPENRARRGGRTIRLAVAIVPAASPTPAPDPIVHLTGGPGGIAMFEAQPLADAGFNRDRDLILLSQRGTKYSEPALTCPEVDRFNARAVGLVYDAASTGREQVAAVRACHRRLEREGIDLSAYDTLENAADVADLRRALGIERWNVFGVSYGTDLALTLMNRDPEGIRSVVLDSVVPPPAVRTSAFWPNARTGFDHLFDACAAQPACRARHPRLAQTFARLVRRLEARPITTRAAPMPGADRVKVVLDGGALIAWLVAKSFATPAFPQVPDAIAALAAGDPQPIAADRAAVTPPNFVGYGLQYSVVCSEWLPFDGPGSVLRRGRRAFPGFPESVLAQAPQGPFLPQTCRAWDVPRTPPVQREITRSAIPALLLAGSFDSVTPLRWARRAARTLRNSTVVQIPGVGHFVTPASPCAQQVIASFVADPAARPDTSCVAGLSPPPFAAG